MKTLFFENKFEVQRIDNEVENLQKKLKEVLADWQTMTTEYLNEPAPLTMDTLKGFYDSKGTAIEPRIEAYLLQLKAEKLKPKYPDFDLDELKRIINRPIAGMILYSLEGIQPSQYWNCLEIEKGKITASKKEIEFLKDHHRDYAESETEMRRLELAKKVVEAMNQILTEYPHVKPSDFHLPKFTFEHEGEICISFQWVKYGRFNNATLPGDPAITFAKRTPGDTVLKPDEPKKIQW